MEPLREIARARTAGHELRPLSDGWEAACDLQGLAAISRLGTLSWIPAQVPGTAAGALARAGAWRPGEPRDLDEESWWFRTGFAAAPVAEDEQVLLRLEGIATIAEVYLNGELVLESESMFASHALDVTRQLHEQNELVIHCLALGPRLRERRRPRARWRTRLVSEGNLRFFRTMLLGRAPGMAPGPAAVGPWREARLERRRRIAVEQLALRTDLAGRDGVLSVRARLRFLGDQLADAVEVEVELQGPSGTHRAELELAAAPEHGLSIFTAEGELHVPDVERWWPHTHGSPTLHSVKLVVGPEPDQVVLDAGRVGFRKLTFGSGPAHRLEHDGLDVHINGVPIFARGAVWTSADPIGLAPSSGELREELMRVTRAGMNMLRVVGTGAYESDHFHDLCDELGILVWQDFMFANLDYPISEDAFRATVESEAAQVLDRLGGRPSLVVLCGNSEIEQQVAMLGLDPALGRGALFGELLPALVRDSAVEAAYVPSAPCGGALPFRPDVGIANYYGVGGYRRGLQDARLAGVRFAAECLALSNVPEPETIAAMAPAGSADPVVHHPAWKAGVPRDAGSGWDFEDVRDHYLRELFGLDPGELRRVDHDRYLELSRMVSGELMSEVFGEWRRSASPCTGGLVLWLRDLLPGAGWGVVDHRGVPKLPYHHLRRALAPVAVWTTDEGLGGVAVHLANDRPTAIPARLRVALYQDFERCVGAAEETLVLAPHGAETRDLEAMLGHFVDASWAYRFAPPAQDVIVASLEVDRAEEPELLSQAVRFPGGRPSSSQSAQQLGLTVETEPLPSGEVLVRLRSRRLAWGVRMRVPGFLPDDDSFAIEPGRARSIIVSPRSAGTPFAGGTVTALNLRGRLAIPGPADGAAAGVER
jgi:beta-mannosidase